MSLSRTRSEETLQTLVNESHDSVLDASDLLLVFSERTLSSAHHVVFGLPISSYTRLRELPLVSNFMHPGISLYRLAADAKNKDAWPLLTIQLSFLAFLKKNSPILVINRWISPTEKTEFCRVFFKVLSNYLTCFVLIFTFPDGSSQSVVLLNNGVRPSVDLLWQNTKLRVSGLTGATSMFGNSLFKMHVMAETSPLLTDNVHLPSITSSSVKKFKPEVKEGHTNPLFAALLNQDKSLVAKMVSEGTPLVNVPLSTYTDSGYTKVAGVRVNGTIRIFENSDSEDLSTNTLVMCCVLLVLREQEISKMRGNNKPSYV